MATRSGVTASAVNEHARSILSRLGDKDRAFTSALYDDPTAAIHSRTDLVIKEQTGPIDSGCSIAAMLLKKATPREILLQRSSSRRRDTFSLLHELCHHLLDSDDEAAEMLFAIANRKRRDQLEEDICDAFAAAVLIDDDVLNEVIADGITARSFVELFNKTGASREACAVALAQRLTSNGYIVVGTRRPGTHADAEVAVARFSARHGDIAAIRRNTPQPSTALDRIGGRSSIREQSDLVLASSATTDTYLCDIVIDGDYLFGVFVSDNPGWGGLSVRDPTPGGYTDQYCDRCPTDFYPNSPACSECGHHPCTECGQCECIKAPPGAGICNVCHMQTPAHRMNGNVCVDCS